VNPRVDGLTGLRLRADIPSAIGEHASPCCLVDIDGLIWVNDQHGHMEGDRVIATVAAQVAQLLPIGGSALFRVGGDELLALFRSLDQAAVREAADRIVDGVRALALPYWRLDRPHRATVEVNVAILPVTLAFAESASSQSGFNGVRAWVEEAVYREKLRTGRDAGIVVDLVDAADCPWAR
jgi:diguanylate cyclase (GGDEF)-like protein